MKKIITIGLLTVCAAVLAAQSDPIRQDWGPDSLENETTAGLFSNEIDEAFVPNADFGSYEQQFIFAGLGNPYKKDEAADPQGKPTVTETRFGYYRPGKMPMSFFGRFKGTVAAENVASGGTKKKWSGNEHNELLSTHKVSYNKVPLFKTYDGTLRFLMAFGAEKRMVTGFYFNIDTNDGGFAKANNVKQDYKDHKDSKKSIKSSAMNLQGTLGEAGYNYNTFIAGNIWNTATGLAEKTGTGSFTHKFTIGVPLAFKTGDLAHVAKFELNADLTHKNAWFEQKQTENNAKFKSTGYNSTVTLGGSYEVEIPAKDREEDAWTVGGGLGLEFKNNELKYEFKADKVNAAKDVNIKYKKTQTPGLSLVLKAEGGRSLVFPSPQRTVIFKIKPTAGFALKTGHADGAYNPKIEGKYSDNSTSHTYKSVTEGYGHKNKTEFSTTLSVPMGLKIMPEGWKFGLLLGAKLETEWKVSGTWNRIGDKHGRVTNTIDSKTTTARPASYDDEPVTTNSLTIKEEHYIGFTIPFEGGARFDVAIKGTDLTKLSTFKIQAFIPLGVPKSK